MPNKSYETPIAVPLTTGNDSKMTYFVNKGTAEGRSQHDLLLALLKGESDSSAGTKQIEGATPESAMQLAKLHLADEMPHEISKMRDLRPMNPIEHLLLGRSALAVTTKPGNNVAYNQTELPYNQSAIDDMLAHELTHVGQPYTPLQDPLQALRDIWQFLTRSHDDRDVEKEPNRVGRSRAAYRHDIKLPKDSQ